MSISTSVLLRYPDYECVIGIEVHVQLSTKTKIFCGCPTKSSSTPNTNVCHICAGHPGVLPVLNERVVEYAVMAGLATHSEIARKSVFARKHYFYPDLPKNYQITQSDLPICTNGYVEIIDETGMPKKIGLMRIHMEEDAGKNLHSGALNESFVDLNRAGTPLLEIVTLPVITSAFEARAYLKELRSIVQYLGICSGNMEEGAFRADTNISVRKKGASKLGTKVELKNINSFKFIADAIEYEIERQIELIEDGGKIKQETRLWDSAKRVTVAMRSKEEAADYRYFDDPDLRPVCISDEFIEKIKASLPELPEARRIRYKNNYGLDLYQTEILIEDLDLASYFEAAAQYTKSSHLINWVLRDVAAWCKQENKSAHSSPLTPHLLAELIELLSSGIINNRTAQELFKEIVVSGASPKALVKERNLEQLGSSDELEKAVQAIVAQHPEHVAEYRAGKQKLFGFFVGQLMKQLGGKANPQILNELLKKHLSQ